MDEKFNRAEYIATLLDKLNVYWYNRPELRLAQIVSNAWRIHPDYKRNPEPDINDVYYFTDAKFLESLELLEKNESKGSRVTEE
jgi:hypothetical protein